MNNEERLNRFSAGRCIVGETLMFWYLHQRMLFYPWLRILAFQVGSGSGVWNPRSMFVLPPPGAGVFCWSRSRHFGPVPAPASILASQPTQIVWYITSFDIISRIKNKLGTIIQVLLVILDILLTLTKMFKKLCSQEPEPAPGNRIPIAPEPPQNRTAPKPSQ